MEELFDLCFFQGKQSWTQLTKCTNPWSYLPVEFVMEKPLGSITESTLVKHARLGLNLEFMHVHEHRVVWSNDQGTKYKVDSSSCMREYIGLDSHLNILDTLSDFRLYRFKLHTCTPKNHDKYCNPAEVELAIQFWCIPFQFKK